MFVVFPRPADHDPPLGAQLADRSQRANPRPARSRDDLAGHSRRRARGHASRTLANRVELRERRGWRASRPSGVYAAMYVLLSANENILDIRLDTR